MASLADGTNAPSASRDFAVFYQKLELEVDFANQSLKGRTELHILPQSKDLKTIRLYCRQSRIKTVTVEGRAVSARYQDPYERIKPHPSYTIHQHHLLRAKIEAQLKSPSEEELLIDLPKGFKIQDTNPFSSDTVSKPARVPDDTGSVAETPLAAAAPEQAVQFAPLKVILEFEVKDVRDGLHFVGVHDGDTRYPHVYTRNSPYPGTASALFPCVDDPTARCSWDISITCPRTLGDAFRKKRATMSDGKADSSEQNGDRKLHNDVDGDVVTTNFDSDDGLGLSEREKALELSVVCSGNMTDDAIIDPEDHSKKIVAFDIQAPVSANQIGFAIGPFETVNLSEFREIDDDDKLGTQAIRVHGFCLPGRAEEVRNTCMPLAKAVDFFTTTYTAYSGSSYKVCFVDDLTADFAATSGFSICSTRLLFPEDIIAPLNVVTRKLVLALAQQYAGISVVAREPSDAWAVAGMASFMTDVFMKNLTGNNEYRFQQKVAADAVYELDMERPSLYDLGRFLHLDPSESDFLALKAGVVLFVLDRRLTKQSGSAGIGRIIGRILGSSKAADVDSTLLSTSQFQRQCEKMGHLKLQSFFDQWVYGAGCPAFQVTQRFNKKRMVVEMLIRQTQAEREQGVPHDLNPESFMRDVKEDVNEVYAGVIQPVFTGPMTIRIHEADGTPYEHIVDIKEANTKFEIPYNTKYKRLKRNRRQKERVAAASGIDVSAETHDDVLLYCLGDVLQSEKEVADWRLTDWSKEDEERMDQESYEWIRMDADFEWICKMNISMPSYMFVSQLQQDRDVVAQMETIQYMAAQKEHPLISTILTRTIMDRRYFHGIRTMAVAGLAKCAKDELDWIGLFHLEKIFQELFCFPNSQITRPNDFSNRTSFLLQCAVPATIAKVKNNVGQAPRPVKQFFTDTLKFNDNTDNEFSDVHYVATLMSGLAETLTGSIIAFDDEDIVEDTFRKDAINAIERYRRIDEWISSYHNIYSITAIDCLMRLAQAQVTPPKLKEFLQYTRPGNADLLRLKAIDCLVELGLLKNDAIFKYFMYTAATDPSPYIRQNAYQIFGKGLGKLAVGEKVNVNAQAIDGLVIEREGSTEERQAELARRQTIEGALAALKVEIGEKQVVKESLWAALISSNTTLREVANFLDLCEVLVESTYSLMVTLKYPRYWRAEHTGKGVVKFAQTPRVRTTSVKPHQWIPAPPTPSAAKPTITKLGPPPVSASPTAAKPLITIPKQILTFSKPNPVAPKSSPVAVKPPAAPKPPKPTPLISRKNSTASSSGITHHTPSPSTATPSTTFPKPSPSPASKLSRIVKLKFKGPFPPIITMTPASAIASPQPPIKSSIVRLKTSGIPRSISSVQASPSSAYPCSSTPLTTIASGINNTKAMSPPLRPSSTMSTSSNTKRQKSATPQPSKAGSDAPSLTSSKKRKTSLAEEIAGGEGVLNCAVQAPPAKKPMLKLKLGGFKVAGAGGAGAESSSAGPKS